MPDAPKVAKPAAVPGTSVPAPSLEPGAKAGADASKSPPSPATELTAEEQMERFAQDLKENDWGHQPC